MTVFVLCGVMFGNSAAGSEDDIWVEVLPGCLIAASAEEAIDVHSGKMRDKFPHLDVAAIKAFVIPDGYVRRAAADLAAKDQQQNQDNDDEAKPAG
jgi:hypothetical protein